MFECGVQKNLKIVDLTGAGDLFAAGALYGLLKDYSLEESAILGSYCAAQVVSHIGGRLPIHAYTDATKILSEYKKDDGETPVTEEVG